MQLSYYERDIIIRALIKVLEVEQPHGRADEYKKLLDRLKEEHEQVHNMIPPNESCYDIDDV